MSRRSPVRLELGLLLRQSHRRAAAALDGELAPLGLSGRHFGVLMLLGRSGVSTQRDLIRRTGSDKAGMVRTVEALERLGYLTRTPSATDRRVAELSLTPEGRTALRRAEQLAGVTADRLFSAFSPDELDTLRSLLERFVAPDQAGPSH